MGNIWLSAWKHTDLAGRLDLAVIAVFSIVSWYIMIENFFLFKALRRKYRTFEKYLLRGKRPPATKSLLDNIYRYGMNLSKKHSLSEERIINSMEKFTEQKIENFGSGIHFLATTSAICPFLGLLGTVWGLLIAFTSISLSGSASVRIVASGVAEALITTIAGLIAAIPAAAGYNYFTINMRNMSSKIELLIPEMVSQIQSKENE